MQRKAGAGHDGKGSKTVGEADVGADVLEGNLDVGLGSLARSSFLAACALAGAPGSRMPVARSQERTRARVAASKVKPRMTEQRARTGDCLRAGGPNWCHICLKVLNKASGNMVSFNIKDNKSKKYHLSRILGDSRYLWSYVMDHLAVGVKSQGAFEMSWGAMNEKTPVSSKNLPGLSCKKYPMRKKQEWV